MEICLEGGQGSSRTVAPYDDDDCLHHQGNE
jgi:hypothetical protein